MMVKSDVINDVEWQLFKSDNPHDLIGPYYLVKKYPDGTSKLSAMGLGGSRRERRQVIAARMRAALMSDGPVKGEDAPF
jgi:hypothetical protein